MHSFPLWHTTPPPTKARDALVTRRLQYNHTGDQVVSDVPPPTFRRSHGLSSSPSRAHEPSAYLKRLDDYSNSPLAEPPDGLAYDQPLNLLAQVAEDATKIANDRSSREPPYSHRPTSRSVDGPRRRVTGSRKRRHDGYHDEKEFSPTNVSHGHNPAGRAPKRSRNSNTPLPPPESSSSLRDPSTQFYSDIAHEKDPLGERLSDATPAYYDMGSETPPILRPAVFHEASLPGAPLQMGSIDGTEMENRRHSNWTPFGAAQGRAAERHEYAGGRDVSLRDDYPYRSYPHESEQPKTGTCQYGNSEYATGSSTRFSRLSKGKYKQGTSDEMHPPVAGSSMHISRNKIPQCSAFAAIRMQESSRRMYKAQASSGISADYPPRFVYLDAAPVFEQGHNLENSDCLQRHSVDSWHENADSCEADASEVEDDDRSSRLSLDDYRSIAKDIKLAKNSPILLPGYCLLEYVFVRITAYPNIVLRTVLAVICNRTITQIGFWYNNRREQWVKAFKKKYEPSADLPRKHNTASFLNRSTSQPRKRKLIPSTSTSTTCKPPPRNVDSHFLAPAPDPNTLDARQAPWTVLMDAHKESREHYAGTRDLGRLYKHFHPGQFETIHAINAYLRAIMTRIERHLGPDTCEKKFGHKHLPRVEKCIQALPLPRMISDGGDSASSKDRTRLTFP
ncbi:hypothetical protein FISHEDRAFT_60921 [Fistulina hepatica ATCC 64428]|uniref:Homeobox domain-containing protein n=1 Tax=Fistulina hepatica ATCC 64428 TaxID=1128425 RepID=A0A0D7A5X4_9AGAR|nr:hypothetical protein FISHEDRAFT_60921 [Fistulina hepatica ATCC 64428]